MWDLIKRNFSQRANLLYFFNAILILYIIGVGLGSHFVQILPPVNFLPTLGTASDIVTGMIIILAALSFSGKKAHRQIDGYLAIHVSKLDIFWSKVITLTIQYVNLILVDVILSVVVQHFMTPGKYINRRTPHVMAIAVGANVLYVFLLASITVLFSTLIKNEAGTIAAGFGFRFLGTAIAGIFMILLYSHRWLKWNPFNALFVGGSYSQINNPIYHAMTKMSMPNAIGSAIIYGIIYLFFAYLIFSRYYKRTEHSSKN